ncbi:SET domain-containing protein [Amylocystis lapponica]|nr:SET domain-containing protein [Amylocystis lapponica]
MATSTATVIPSETDLKEALIVLRAENPTLGIAKLHALLTSTHPTWVVSEKRTRKILQSEGLVLGPAAAAKNPNFQKDALPLPSSRVIEGLNVAKWTSTVEVRFFGRTKGKGLVAKEPIAEGDVLWQEDPFVLAPEMDIYDLQMSSVACSYCSTPLHSAPITTSCPASSSGTPCPAKFCNRLCLARSRRTHPLLCPVQNPASTPLRTFARQNQWQALHALSQCAARILLTHEQDEAAFRADWEVFTSFAQLGMEERAKGEWMKGVQPDRAMWAKASSLFTQAFHEPATVPDKKRLARLLKKPLGKEIADEFFEYDAFLRGLGRMSLNLESHGGLYVLHSHLNHSCTPNISVRHMDQRTALSRITVVARRNIAPGEELCITYVDPGLPVEQRRRQLMEWGFGTCRCVRCVAEEGSGVGQADAAELEMELKAGLGVM